MKIKRLSAFLAFAFAILGAVAQNGTMTPYSAYGYGVLRDNATSIQRAMGGVGYAMSSGRQINAMNPASYAAIDTLTFLFDMGIDLTAVWQSERDDKGVVTRDKNLGGGLDYATMQFPLGRYMGGSVGVVPFSSVGYSFGSEIENGFDSRQGGGSINELYVGVAGRPFKGFTIGANISYLFGTVLNETYAMVTSSQSALFQTQLIVRDFRLNFGAQYGVNIGADRLTLGLTYSPSKTLLGHARQVFYDTSLDQGPQFTDEHSLKNNYSIPETWGAGINYQWDNKLMLEFDYTYQPWSKAKFRVFSDDPSTAIQSFANRNKFALGMQWVPNRRGSYGKRINYRLGAFYSDDYLVLRGNQLKEHGVTCGVGLPVPAFKSTVNIGLEWRARSGHPNSLIKENYLSLTLGVNFNEMWFRQSKIY